MDRLDEDHLESWLATMRPRLHAFCGRMMGSAVDGEDAVQEALARAAAAYADAAPLSRPEAWLFRIARNAAIDLLRQRRGGTQAHPENETADPAADAASRITVTLGFTAFLPLRPPQRAAVILIDILGYSAAETATILETSVAAIKAALHRGRARLATSGDGAPPPAPDPRERLRLRAYADLFNARAFDALRDMLATDVRLDLPAKIKLAGKRDVSVYFERYAQADVRWQLRPVLFESKAALLASNPANVDDRYVIMLGWQQGRIATIRDFLHARYIVDGTDITDI